MFYPIIFQCVYICTFLNSDFMTPAQLRIVQTCLQESVGPSPVIDMVSFSNWAEVVSYDHVFMVNPKTVQEIQRVVSAARFYRRHVRAIGSTHSISPHYAGRGNINLNLTDLTLEGGKTVVLKPAGPTHTHAIVRAATGLNQGRFDEELDTLGYAFPYGPLIAEPHVGGSLGTASHAGFYNSGTMGAFLVGAKLVDGLGCIKEFTEESDPQIMKALRCNLGLLGVIFEVELKVVPQGKYIHSFTFTPLKNLYDPNFLREIITRNHHVNIWHNPYTSLTEEEAQAVLKTGLVPDTWDMGNDLAILDIVNPESNPVDLGIIDERPESFNVTVVSQGQEAFKDWLAKPPSEVVNFGKAVHYNAAEKHMVITEYLFPDPDFAEGAAAIMSLVKTFNRESRTKGIQLMKDHLFRWIRGTACLLCAASHQSTGTVVPSGQLADTPNVFGSFNLETIRTDERELQLTKDLYKTIISDWENGAARIPNGRPHWAKLLDIYPDLAERTRAVYGEDVDTFLNIRQSLDPHGVFANPLFRKALNFGL